MSAILLSAAAAAALNTYAELPITVLAGRVEEQSSLADPLTVFDAQRIRSLNLPQVGDLLRLMPGVSVNVAGPAGSLTQVRIRGAEANHTLTFIDGIEANDPATSNETRFETLSADNVTRVELLRGPQSALWGAEALGGVIALTTPLSTNGLAASAQGEYGSHDTTRLSAFLSGGSDKGAAAISASWFNTDGIDALGQGGERDGFENLTINAKAVLRPAPDGELGIAARYNRADSAFDGYNAFYVRDQTLDATRIETRAVRGWATYGTGEAAPWTFTVEGTLIDSDNRNRVGSTPLNRTDAQRFKAGAQLTHRFAIGPSTHRLTIAAENVFERFTARDQQYFGATDQRRTREKRAWLAEWRGQLNGLDLGAVIRQDDSNRFGQATTVKADAALKVGGGFNLHGGYSEGFAQPSFYDLYGFFPGDFLGNPNLKPERGWNAEAGIGWSNDWLGIDATAFTGRLKDEIVDVFDSVTSTSSTANAAGKSRREGFDLTVDARPVEWLRLAASYSYLKSRQQTAPGGARVAEVRRPKHSAAFSADARLDRFTIGLGVSYAGARPDDDFDVFPAARVRLDSYVLASLNIAYRLTDLVELYVRGANLADERYQDALGYATEGRTVFAGVRVRLGQ